MKTISAFLGMAFIGLTYFPAAFGQTTIDAEIRPRSEFREGYKKPLADTLDPAFVTLQRTRFNLDYQGKILNAHITFQDSRIWGNSNNKTNASKIELHEAWFEYLVTSGVSVKMGRQQLKYDDQRLLAASNWSNTGLSHDIVVIKYKTPFIQLHSGFAYNNSSDTTLNVTYTYSPKQTYKTMGYVWASKKLSKYATLSVIGICEGFEKKSDYSVVYPRVTYGGNLVFANDSLPWGATLTYYGQSGKTPLKTYGRGYASLQSDFIAALFSYKFTKKVSGNIGLDYYSGSDATIDVGKSNTFNRLYGTTHSYNGNMDYFTSLPTQGLVDYYGGITAKIAPKLTVALTGHLFYLDKDFVYKNVKQSKNMGSELDLVLKYPVSKEISVEGGYSRYFNSGTTSAYYKMQDIGIKPQQWAYIMLTIKPQLYKTPPLVTKE